MLVTATGVTHFQYTSVQDAEGGQLHVFPAAKVSAVQTALATAVRNSRLLR